MFGPLGVISALVTGVVSSWGKTLAFVIFVLPPLIGWIIRLLGIVAVTYVGTEIVLDYVTDLIMEKFNGLPSDLLMVLKLAGLDTVFKMIIATVGAVLVLKAFGRPKKFKFFA